VPASKKDLKPRARSRFAAGLSLEQIAAELGVSVATISRWKAFDKRAGHSWEQEAPISDLADLRDVISALIKRLRSLAHDESMGTPAWADALMKLMNSLDKTIGLFGDSLQLMIAMDRFSRWFEERLKDEDLALVRRVVNGFVADLKEEAK